MFEHFKLVAYSKGNSCDFLAVKTNAGFIRTKMNNNFKFDHFGCSYLGLVAFSFLFFSKAQASETDSNALIYSSFEGKGREIYSIDTAGKKRTKLASYTLADGYPVVSPDGDKFAFYGKYDGYKTWSIHSANIDGSSVVRLTNDKNVRDAAPSWSPDGQHILFSRNRVRQDGNTHEEIWIMNADGSEQKQIKGLSGGGASFMPDGRIVFHSKTGASEISIANRDGSNIITLTNNDAEDWHPEVSPDGKQVAFMSDRDGNREIYVMDIDGTNERRLTNNELSDWDPVWSPDSSKIAFVSDNVEGLYDIHIINVDGSGLYQVVKNGSQPSGVIEK
ncbi:TolB family protein [Planctobacterium marinum]|uniref:TolB family protein n=1 Tax=Planctobacterium marinum TaxID=1631968 RepID=UPI001E37964C|nr:DUF5050 domain-containing protein [Planctobacterium marinum]MCC2605746.1 DUF5050 domain-containing protein [Planctobacterium marinum]